MGSLQQLWQHAINGGGSGQSWDGSNGKLWVALRMVDSSLPLSAPNGEDLKLGTFRHDVCF